MTFRIGLSNFATDEAGFATFSSNYAKSENGLSNSSTHGQNGLVTPLFFCLYFFIIGDNSYSYTIAIFTSGLDFSTTFRRFLSVSSTLLTCWNGHTNGRHTYSTAALVAFSCYGTSFTCSKASFYSSHNFTIGDFKDLNSISALLPSQIFNKFLRRVITYSYGFRWRCNSLRNYGK